MKAFNKSCRKPFDRLASSFSLTEKWPRKRPEPDEHSQTGILTSASNLIPPSRRRSCTHEAGQWLWEFVAVTVAQPSRIFTGFPDIRLRTADDQRRPFQRTFRFYARNRSLPRNYFQNLLRVWRNLRTLRRDARADTLNPPKLKGNPAPTHGPGRWPHQTLRRIRRRK
jgi:hypothetical protein